MRQTCFIGVDIGTQGTKAALYGADGTLLADAFEASELISLTPGHVEQDPEAMYGSVLRTIRILMDSGKADASQIGGIGVDAQMAGIQGVGQHWEPVTPYDSWLDRRCEPYIAQMKAHEADVIASTGGQVTCAHGPKVLWWMHEHPDVYGKIAKFILPTTYAVGRLCGLSADEAYIDTTHLHFAGFSDAGKRAWNPALLDLFGVDADKMPRIVDPSTVIGGLTAEAAAACGLLAGTPVVAGCGDSAASSLGAGMTEAGRIYDVAGTASIFSCTTTAFAPDLAHKTILYMHSAVEGLWSPLAYISGGGLCISWFKNLLGCTYKELDAEAATVASGSEGLLFIPHFAGRTCPSDARLHGSFLGLDWKHGRAQMYRAIMESIAYEYKMYLDRIRQADPTVKVDAIYGAGGGAHSAVFGKIKADVLGVPYIPLTCGDTGSFGSAVLAGYGVGYYTDLSAAARLNVRESDPILPDAAAHAAYTASAAAYVRALDAAGTMYEEVAL